ncbi:hypothetical protein F751_1692 [Auxenochlorella protothecoides]|uniref:Uncharacterized protein n=1 Tax=Auxenochlorella protothecoides TaxID=3075 RepID=A0A087SGF9_AUXPR|nr:hypothetical protein F751_1692 [Auxenochlorella protothecoides]KFM24813.1 hypothetical protein F751_1692 [Auxenochlorella protothecoides]
MSGKLPNGFREHSFLSKPEAAELNASRLLVTICQDAEEGCAAGDAAAEVQDGGVRLVRLRSLEQLRVALSGALEKHKLLHFTGGMGRALILSPEEVERFGSRLNSFTSIHCCVKAPVGHIWYDLFWDIPGHTDRHQRTQQGEMSGKLPNGFREHSFLSKPEAAELNASRLLVTICQDAEEGCAAGDAAAEVQDGGVRLQPGRSLEQLRVALSGALEKHKLLHFTGGMGRALILSPEEVERFGSRLNSFTSIHCCVKAPVGHIWYDLFWDIPGHTDRHQRTQQGEWKPQLGP